MYKLLYNIGQFLRNPSIKKWDVFLKHSDKWSKEKLEAYQFEQLKKILNLAYHTSPFYKRLWDKHNFHPDEITNLNDVHKIPTLDKNALITNASEIHTSIKFKKVFNATTSGSTGNSLQFKRDEEADSFNRAVIIRGYSWYQVKPWEFSGYFWGFNFTFWDRIKTRILDGFQNRYRIFSYNEKTFRKFVKKIIKASYLSGYSSMLYDTAKLINKQGLKKPKQLKLVVGTSEKILDAYQEEVKKAFGLKIISEYGATESGIIAFECPEGNMHITMEGVLVEELNHEIIVTNLVMQSFPVIRYCLGDYIKLAPDEFKCKCGRNHRVLEEVTGRIGDVIRGKTLQYPSLYCYYIFKNLSNYQKMNMNYQVLQLEEGNLIINIEQSLNENNKKHILNECKKYFNDDVAVSISDNFKTMNRTQKENSFRSFIKK